MSAGLDVEQFKVNPEMNPEVKKKILTLIFFFLFPFFFLTFHFFFFGYIIMNNFAKHDLAENRPHLAIPELIEADLSEKRDLSDLSHLSEKKSDPIPLSYDHELNENFNKVILIHHEVQDLHIFINACKEDVFPIIYHSRSTKDELKKLLEKKSFEHLALIFHDANLESKQFLDSQLFTDDDFLETIIIDSQVKHVDFLACHSLKHESWRNYYQKLEEKTGAIISASEDATGNLKYGGDWILENNQVDVQEKYFNSTIDNYAFLLQTTTINTSTTLTQALIDSYTFPVTISGGTSGNPVVITLGEDLTLNNDNNKYFIIGSEYITFEGKYEGNNKIITVNNVPNYPGLIQNGTSSTNGKTNITIQNIGVETSGSTSLATSGGWLGQNYFGKGIFTGTISVSNCYSSGNILGESSGGIFGSYCGFQASGDASISVSNCYSSGNISAYGSGGIFGAYCGEQASGGSISASNCYSSGNIFGQKSGGIFGQQCGQEISGDVSISASNCYSSGNISGFNSGGIFGDSCGIRAFGGSISAENCYSIGRISTGGGGIYGSVSGNSASGGSISAENCYSSGEMSGDSSGGIFGQQCGQQISGDVSISASNCYSSGNISAYGSGGIFGSQCGSNAYGGSISAENCYSSGNISGSGSGGIFGNAARLSTSDGSVNALNCYTIGRITGSNAGGIYGAPNFGGTKTNCIASDNNTWADSQASETIAKNSNSWIDIDVSASNVPWLLNTFDAQIYNPNEDSGTTDYESNEGLFSPDYTYSIISVNNNQKPDEITIDGNNGKIIFGNLDPNRYIVQVLTGKINSNSSVYTNYQINTFTLTYITTNPTMTISSNQITSGTTTSLTTINFTFTSSENTTDFTEEDITISNGTLSSFSGSGTTYTVLFSPTSEGECSLVVPADSYTDSEDRNNLESNTFTFTFDKEPKMIISSEEIISGQITKLSSLNFTFTSSENTSDFVQNDISVINGTLSNFIGSDNTYNVVFTPKMQGYCSLVVPENAYTDNVGNGNAQSNTFTFFYEKSIVPFTYEIPTNASIPFVINAFN